MLSVENLRSGYGRIEALHGVSLAVAAGEIVVGGAAGREIVLAATRSAPAVALDPGGGSGAARRDPGAAARAVRRSPEPGAGRRPDYVRAAGAWEMAATLGDPVAMCFLASLLEHGLGTAPDRPTALTWYLSAKAAGGCPGVDEAIGRLRR